MRIRFIKKYVRYYTQFKTISYFRQNRICDFTLRILYKIDESKIAYFTLGNLINKYNHEYYFNDCIIIIDNILANSNISYSDIIEYFWKKVNKNFLEKNVRRYRYWIIRNDKFRCKPLLCTSNLFPSCTKQDFDLHILKLCENITLGFYTYIFFVKFYIPIKYEIVTNII